MGELRPYSQLGKERSLPIPAISTLFHVLASAPFAPQTLFPTPTLASIGTFWICPCKRRYKKFTKARYITYVLNQRHEDTHWRNVWRTLHLIALWQTRHILLINGSCCRLRNGTRISIVVGRCCGLRRWHLRACTLSTAVWRWTGIHRGYSRTVCISCTADHTMLAVKSCCATVM